MYWVQELVAFSAAPRHKPPWQSKSKKAVNPERGRFFVGSNSSLPSSQDPPCFDH
jgi:hypothetical protein